MKIIEPFRGIQLNKTHPLSRGLVGTWLMNEQSGNKVFDFSGNGNHGTCVNMNDTNWVAGKRGNALNFNGVDEYINCGNDDNLGFGENITISAWVKSNDITLIQNIVNRNWTDNYWMGIENSKIAFRIRRTNTVGETKYSDNILLSSIFYHLAIVYKNFEKKVYFYVNGQSDGTGIYTLGMKLTNWGILNIGYYGGGDINYFNGLIDKARFYNRALSSDEIRMLYSETYQNFE